MKPVTHRSMFVRPFALGHLSVSWKRRIKACPPAVVPSRMTGKSSRPRFSLISPVHTDSRERTVWRGPTHRRFVRAGCWKGEKKRRRDLPRAAPSSIPRHCTGAGEREGECRVVVQLHRHRSRGSGRERRRCRGEVEAAAGASSDDGRGRIQIWGGPPSKLRPPPDRHAARAPSLLLHRPMRHRQSCPRWSRHVPMEEDGARSARRS
jgi:hypothetical protein